jgi:hypothetical protein
MQAGQEASLRTSVLLVVDDITSRIQVNRKGVTFYTGDGTNHDCHSTAGGCTPQALAKKDMFLWKKNISKVLPAGTVGDVTVTPSTNGVFKVKVEVTWKDHGDNKSYTSNFWIYTR